MKRAVVEDRAVGRRVLEQRAEDLRLVEVEGAVVADDHLDAERLGAGLHHLDGLRVAVLRDEEGCRPPCRATAWNIVIASAAAVPSSSSEALATRAR